MTNTRVTLPLIAGYCPEEAIWKLVADICGILKKAGKTSLLIPNSIWVDGQNFMIDDRAEAVVEFLPPEYKKEEPLTAAQQIWTIGALICYVSSGRVPFGGHGGQYQRKFPNASLPVLQKAHQKMTPVVQRCLQYNPELRIGLDELASIAQQELVRCQKQERIRVAPKTSKAKIKTETQDNWPEAMVEK